MFYVAWWPGLSKGGWLVPQVWWWGWMGPQAHELHACFVCAGGWITRSSRAGTKAGAARTNAGAALALVPGGRFRLKSIPFTNAGAAPAQFALPPALVLRCSCCLLTLFAPPLER